MPFRRPLNAIRRALLVLVALAFVSALPEVLLAQPPAPPIEMLEDAELTDVLFLDPDRGFAIGDRGAIWRTDNGGRHWRLINSPVACRWESIYFVDEQNGFIVGGYTQPLSHQSRGVILRTKDGGRTWAAIPKLLLPTIKQIGFLDPKHGWAVGHVAEFFPSGVFRTSDGGQTWTPHPSSAPVGWHAAAFHDAQRGVLVGAEGHVATLHGPDLQPARMPAIGPRPVRRVSLADARHGWLIGDGGLVLSSNNGGLNWTLPLGDIPTVLREQLDFRALAVRGPHCWMAGAPGTIVLHSGDRGQTWQTFRTDQTAPLRALFFLDEDRGWAVGALGTVLATRDGGQTWQAQRRGGARAAVLSLVSEPQRVPLEVLARLGGNEGYLTATEILTCGDFTLPRNHRVPAEERTHAAITQLGGSLADSSWRFPLRQRELKLSGPAIIDLWNRVNNGQGVEALEAHVVRKIRQWRPEVILTERTSPRGEDPLAHATNQIVLAAVAKAADPKSYPEQLSELGLEPWKTKKVLSALPPETPGTVNLSTAQLAPRLGGSLADVSTASRGLIFDDYRPAPLQLGFQLLINALPSDLGERDFMSGIVVTPGSDGRRVLAETSQSTLETLRREAQRSRNIQHLLARSTADSHGGASWLGQVDNLTRGLSKASAASTLYELGWRYQRTGQSAAAADAFELLIERYPEHELADTSALWLVQFYASREAGTRLRRGTRTFSFDSIAPERQVSHEQELNKPTLMPAGAPPSLNMRAELKTAAPGLNPLDRAHRANDLGKKIEQTRPLLFAQPELRFSLATAQRQIGFAKPTEGFFRSVSQQRSRDAWWACAQSELWLVQPTVESPKFSAKCVRVSERPKLDGQLDDTIWQAAKPLELHSAAVDPALPPATALLAQDGEFLYLAVTCAKAAGVSYPEALGKRRYDADLTDRDRIELHIDLDRDYATYFSLACDHRGFTSDACLGDTTWNPTWYVATAHTDTHWTIEVALPLPELDARPPQPRDTWAIGLQRIIPSVGLQSWSQPAAASVLPQGFGLLTFE